MTRASNKRQHFSDDARIALRARPLCRSMRPIMILLLVVGSIAITGCHGCGLFDSSKTAEEKKKDKEDKEKEERKPDFVYRAPILVPGYYPPKYDPEKEKKRKKKSLEEREEMDLLNNRARRYNRHKLGHWVESHLPVISNNFNAEGRLTSHSITASGSPVAVPSTDFYAITNRPVSLGKGEWKNLETSIFLPRRDIQAKSITVNHSFGGSGSSIPYVDLAEGTILMKPFQYHIVILSEKPDSYNYFRMTDSVILRQDSAAERSADPFYFVVPSVFDEPVPLPRQSLNWTTIAYVIWDDFDPTKLSTEQQQSLLDWIHFGGQLILSGPDCLDRLQNSFLAEYLPAHFDGSRNLTNKDLVELNKHWAVPAKQDRPPRTLKVSDEVPLLGVKFLPHQNAQYVDGMGDLAIERGVGRGRILITAFSMNSAGIRKWGSFQSFINGVVLRRPARVFKKDSWSTVCFEWDRLVAPIQDPLIGSGLRYISRDLASDGTPKDWLPEIAAEDQPVDWRRSTNTPLEEKAKNRDVRNHQYFGGFKDSPSSGVAGWNDDSGIATAARDTLIESAGIVPPSSTFVLKMLGIYLAVLVPLNWLVFRLIGKVEWAWIAAPFIAIGGAVGVVRMASLDIGFVRSNTQVGLVEIHADFPRAHVTEFSALYTSLSTNYEVDLDNASAQSLPFASVNESIFKKPKDKIKPVNLRRGVQNRLEGMPIQSNSTGLLHTEYMLDLEGRITLSQADDGQPLAINNGTMLKIQNCGVVQRNSDGGYQLAWIGDLEPQVAADLKFEPTTESEFSKKWFAISPFGNHHRQFNQMWNEQFGELSFVSIEDIRQMKTIKENWDSLHSRLIEMASENVTERKESNLANAESMVSRSQMERVLSSLRTNERIQIGRMFDVLLKMDMAPGEIRLIGSTDQKLGRTKFNPDATQTDRQALVVAHMKRPPLPPARRDVNSFGDLVPKSDLDWEKEHEQDADPLFSGDGEE